MNRFRRMNGLVLIALALVACDRAPASAQGPESRPSTATSIPDDAAMAIFAGGCFWCMEGPFEQIDGVYAAISGYTGGPEESPSYTAVASGSTGHLEAVRVMYDPAVVSYADLLEVYWRTMDPTDAGGQFADRGAQYAPAIFVANEEERAAAEASRAALDADGPFDEPIIVPIRDAGPFWDAEAYHQDYYLTHPTEYQRYRRGSGRERFLQQHWGDAAH